MFNSKLKALTPNGQQPSEDGESTRFTAPQRKKHQTVLATFYPSLLCEGNSPSSAELAVPNGLVRRPKTEHSHLNVRPFPVAPRGGSAVDRNESYRLSFSFATI